MVGGDSKYRRANDASFYPLSFSLYPFKSGPFNPFNLRHSSATTPVQGSMVQGKINLRGSFRVSGILETWK
jgi:hypothetical protein